MLEKTHQVTVLNLNLITDHKNNKLCSCCLFYTLNYYSIKFYTIKLKMLLKTIFSIQVRSQHQGSNIFFFQQKVTSLRGRDKFVAVVIVCRRKNKEKKILHVFLFSPNLAIKIFLFWQHQRNVFHYLCIYLIWSGAVDCGRTCVLQYSRR